MGDSLEFNSWESGSPVCGVMTSTGSQWFSQATLYISCPHPTTALAPACFIRALACFGYHFKPSPSFLQTSLHPCGAGETVPRGRMAGLRIWGSMARRSGCNIVKGLHLQWPQPHANTRLLLLTPLQDSAHLTATKSLSHLAIQKGRFELGLPVRGDSGLKNVAQLAGC